MCNKLNNTMNQDAPTQKFGYLDIKQSSKVKGRKLKSWRHRWVVLTKMSDLSSDQIVGRLDIFENEAKWKAGSADRTTYILEQVTSIERANSRTHPYAFEIVERQPVLVLSGGSELESYSWILTMQQIFTPEVLEGKKDKYKVEVLDNEHSKKWSLKGEYTLTVSSSCISVLDSEGNTCVSWGLSTLMKFNLEKHPVTQEKTVLEIQCGINSPTGQSTFLFHSSEAVELFSIIRHSICLALAKKQSQNRTQTRPRTFSATISEKSFQNLLDSNPVHVDLGRDRSGSDSSSSTVTGPGSPCPNGFSDSPTANGGPGLMAGMSKVGSVTTPNGCSNRPPRLSDVGRSNSARSSSDPNSSLGAIQETTDVCESSESPTQLAQSLLADTSKPRSNSADQAMGISKSSSSNKNDPGYSVIKDSSKGEPVVPPRRRRNTVATSPFEVSQPTEVSKASKGKEPKRKVSSFKKFVSFGNDNRTSSVGETEQSQVNADDLDDTDSSKKDSDHHYQELDAVKDFGRLNRRRSSSTSDLSIVFKLRNLCENNFENVYEELDEMRHAVSRLNSVHVADTETPPALPARPFSMTFTSRDGQDNRQENKKKRSFFKNTKLARTRSASTSSHSLSNNGEPCTCDEIRVARLKTISRDGKCVVCGGDDSSQFGYRSLRSDKRWSSSEEMIGSSGSSFNDVYTTIPDVARNMAKRRRSSDITPVSTSALPVSAKYKSLPTTSTKASCETGASSGSNDRLIDLSSDGSDVRSNKPPRIDPLMSFFLDDKSFDSNPMVTGQLQPTSSTASSSLDLLTLNINTTMTAPPNVKQQQQQQLQQTLIQQQRNAMSTMIPSISPFITTSTAPLNFNSSPNTTTIAHPGLSVTAQMGPQAQLLPSWNASISQPIPTTLLPYPTSSPPLQNSPPLHPPLKNPKQPPETNQHFSQITAPLPPMSSPPSLPQTSTPTNSLFPFFIPGITPGTQAFKQPFNAALMQHQQFLLTSAGVVHNLSSPALDTYMAMTPKVAPHANSWATFDDSSTHEELGISESEDIYVSPTTPLQSA